MNIMYILSSQPWQSNWYTTEHLKSLGTGSWVLVEKGDLSGLPMKLKIWVCEFVLHIVLQHVFDQLRLHHVNIVTYGREKKMTVCLFWLLDPK